MKLFNIQNAWTVNTRNKFRKGGMPISIVGNNYKNKTHAIPVGTPGHKTTIIL